MSVNKHSLSMKKLNKIFGLHQAMRKFVIYLEAWGPKSWHEYYTKVMATKAALRIDLINSITWHKLNKFEKWVPHQWR